MSTLLRQHAEQLFAEELQELKKNDTDKFHAECPFANSDVKQREIRIKPDAKRQWNSFLCCG